MELATSTLAPGVSPVRIAVREYGAGPSVVLLHGGWGYGAYPFDRQIDALAGRYHFVAPDRSGYGRSTPIDALPIDFHQRAADETLAVIDALELERPVLWGHSDGAIIALLIGLARPDAIAGVIIEATHYFKQKPRSRAFFEGIVAAPRSPILAMHSRAWCAIGDSASGPQDDFYGGRLSELTTPALVIHGAQDPRTEPGELEALREVLERRADHHRQGYGGPPKLHAKAEALRHCMVLPEGGHSPHTEPATADRVTAAAEAFLAEVAQGFSPADPA